MNKLKQKGFTIVEIMIVVIVIGILAAIMLVGYSGTQAKTRDSVRKHDLDTIQDALRLNYTNNGNWVGTGSGCGLNGDGTGYFSHINGTTYLKSISNCLKEAGYLKADIVDPTGGTTSTRATGYAYMKYHCGTAPNDSVYLYAKLETEPQNDLATDGTCNSTLDTSYGMNYVVRVK